MGLLGNVDCGADREADARLSVGDFKNSVRAAVPVSAYSKI